MAEDVKNKSLEWKVLEELREYIVECDIEISCRDDLLSVFIEMKEDYCFSFAEEKEKMREARRIFKKFADLYESDHSIWEKDLQILGPTIVLEKIEKNKKR